MSEVLVSFKHRTSYGSVYGIYIMSLDDWKKIKYLQEEVREFYLSEVAGKHSDVLMRFDSFTLVTNDVIEISTFRNLFGETFGSYDLIDYVMELYDEITYEEEEEL